MTSTPTPVQTISLTDQERMSEQLTTDMARAEANGEHLWIVAVAYRISHETATRAAAGGKIGAVLGLGDVVSLAPGCFICEEPLTPWLVGRRCRGSAGGL